jgi:hypothetical protein
MIWMASKQDVIDHLIYSGASQYDWYVRLDEEDGKMIVEMENPDDPELTITKTVTATQVKEVIKEMTKAQAGGWKTVELAVKTDDFDSDGADIVWQWVVFGEVVYG